MVSARVVCSGSLRVFGATGHVLVGVFNLPEERLVGNFEALEVMLPVRIIVFVVEVREVLDADKDLAAVGAEKASDERQRKLHDPARARKQVSRRLRRTARSRRVHAHMRVACAVGVA